MEPEEKPKIEIPYESRPAQRKWVPHQTIGALLALGGACLATAALNANGWGFAGGRYFIAKPSLTFWLGIVMFFGGLVWYAHGRTKEDHQ